MRKFAAVAIVAFVVGIVISALPIIIAAYEAGMKVVEAVQAAGG